jgi:hypothetical protein
MQGQPEALPRGALLQHEQAVNLGRARLLRVDANCLAPSRRCVPTGTKLNAKYAG